MAEFAHVHAHERTDARVRPLAIFLVIMMATLVFAFAFTGVLFEFFTQRAASLQTPPNPLQIQDEMPPEPRLEVVPGLNLRQLRGSALERLNGYGWVDPENRVVHIPIERAIDLVVEKGLPARSAPAPAGGGATAQGGR